LWRLEPILLDWLYILQALWYTVTGHCFHF
jgi:hypothetical protein